jgi:hypothetical protein
MQKLRKEKLNVEHSTCSDETIFPARVVELVEASFPIFGVTGNSSFDKLRDRKIRLLTHLAQSTKNSALSFQQSAFNIERKPGG